MLTIGVDIGGTKIAAGLVTPEGTMTHSVTISTPTDSRHIVDAVSQLVAELSQDHDIGGVGVAAAGFIDTTAGTITSSNIAWRQEPLLAQLRERLARPVVLENDANAAGWAEFRFGAGRGTSDMVMLTMGTGVGGAVVTDGELRRGATGRGGELGHIRFEREGLLCGCGQRGCIEQYASGRALQRIAHEIADAGHIGAELSAARLRDGELSSRAVSELVLAGDRGAVEAVRMVAVALGEACGTYHAMLEPERFVIGGGVSALGEILLAPMREAFRTHSALLIPPGSDMFRTAELLNDAGVIGAGDLARREMR